MEGEVGWVIEGGFGGWKIGWPESTRRGLSAKELTAKVFRLEKL